MEMGFVTLPNSQLKEATDAGRNVTTCVRIEGRSKGSRPNTHPTNQATTITILLFVQIEDTARRSKPNLTKIPVQAAVLPNLMKKGFRKERPKG